MSTAAITSPLSSHFSISSVYFLKHILHPVKLPRLELKIYYFIPKLPTNKQPELVPTATPTEPPKTTKMSFLTEVSTRRMATLSRTRFTTVPRATFTTSVYLRKSIVDAGKDALKTADRAVSDKIVDGIDVGGMFKTIQPCKSG